MAGQRLLHRHRQELLGLGGHEGQQSQQQAYGNGEPHDRDGPRGVRSLQELNTSLQ